MKQLFLTSIIAMGIVPTAFAAPSHTSGTFPEYMLEDYTYTGAATYANTGVYSGDIVANANYNDCPANSWCDNSGQHACSTLSGGYNSSAAGATANTDCYRACNINNMGSGGSIASIAHATALTGNDYYNGTNTDTCEPSACETGYHVQPGVPDPDLNTIIGTTAGTDSGYISNDGNNTSNQSTYGLSNNGTFAVDYGNKGIITGKAQCSTQAGTNNNWTWSNPTISSSLPYASGKYCYCQLDGYTPSGGNSQSLSAPWVFNHVYDGNCPNYCAANCALYLRSDGTNALAFRAAVFGLIPAGPASCETTIYNCAAGTYLPHGTETCVTCLANHYCPGGGYTYSTTLDGGITACPSGMFAPAGMSESAQCGRILHIGDATMYLRTVKKTIPSLNIDINNDGVPDFFGNITTTQTGISKGGSNMFKVNNGGTTYYIHDDSISAGELPNQT